MTHYHYVQTKDELIALMDDAIMAEMLVSDEEWPEDWRSALTTIAAAREPPWSGTRGPSTPSRRPRRGPALCATSSSRWPRSPARRPTCTAG